MRPREVIEKQSKFESDFGIMQLQLEVLLDIRELALNKTNEMTKNEM